MSALSLSEPTRTTTLKSLKQLCAAVISRSQPKGENRDTARDLLESGSYAEGMEMINSRLEARGRINTPTLGPLYIYGGKGSQLSCLKPRYNYGGRIDSARLESYDATNRTVTIRVDHSPCPDFWLQIQLPLGQLETWLGHHEAAEDDDKGMDFEDKEEEKAGKDKDEEGMDFEDKEEENQQVLDDVAPSSLDGFTKEILSEIFLFCAPLGFLRKTVALVCKAFYEVTRDVFFIQRYCLYHIPGQHYGNMPLSVDTSKHLRNKDFIQRLVHLEQLRNNTATLLKKFPRVELKVHGGHSSRHHPEYRQEDGSETYRRIGKTKDDYAKNAALQLIKSKLVKRGSDRDPDKWVKDQKHVVKDLILKKCQMFLADYEFDYDKNLVKSTIAVHIESRRDTVVPFFVENHRDAFHELLKAIVALVGKRSSFPELRNYQWDWELMQIAFEGNLFGCYILPLADLVLKKEDTFHDDIRYDGWTKEEQSAMMLGPPLHEFASHLNKRISWDEDTQSYKGTSPDMHWCSEMDSLLLTWFWFRQETTACNKMKLNHAASTMEVKGVKFDLCQRCSRLHMGKWMDAWSRYFPENRNFARKKADFAVDWKIVFQKCCKKKSKEIYKSETEEQGSTDPHQHKHKRNRVN